ncbi:hypothetical protein [Streptomyces sp. KL116D]|uniref:hypothetical protein n=1 Tax=Streptomyces sp. KL116D TaxID=3045152 RepID=UPI0035560A51
MADENAPDVPVEERNVDAQPEPESSVETTAVKIVHVSGADVALMDGDIVLHSRATQRKPRRDSPVESADETLKRGAEPEIANEILAGGAVAASFTAAASIAKAKIEATTQRRKNHLDAETERMRIAADERIAGLQAMRAQAEPEGPEPDAG